MGAPDAYIQPIVVVIATSNARTDLLLQRALLSVYSQKKVIPLHTYIVDDNPIEAGAQYSKEFDAIKAGVEKLRGEMLKPLYRELLKHTSVLEFDNLFHTSVIPNARTHGNSGTGAWNTAAMHALQYSKYEPFLAILDDDDEWSDKHLASCVKAANPWWYKLQPQRLRAKPHKECVAVVSDIKRDEGGGKTETLKPRAKSFTAERFFEDNPGLQGSNIFIDLTTFWTIGGFDESMPSCTDRDLAIRLCEYVERRESRYIAFTKKTTVHHYAFGSAGRVTTDIEAKRRGLNAFYRKYWHRFGDESRSTSLARATARFNYAPPLSSPAVQTTPLSPQSTANPKTKITPFNLQIGTISDSRQKVEALLRSFATLYERDKQWLKNYTFHILDNAESEFELKPIVEYFRREVKLNVELIARQGDTKLNIATGRTRLQQHILEFGRKKYKDDFVTWIVDDDSLFCVDLRDGAEFKPRYFEVIAKHRGKGVDAMFGMVSDAPPLPFTSTIRTQMLDFYYNLTNFANCAPRANAQDTILNSWQRSNAECENCKEFYYDLSTVCFQHLERPHYWRFTHADQPNTEIHTEFKRFLTETTGLARGVNVFRKITYTLDEIGELKDEPSIHRGGNTIIYEPEMLSVENYTPKSGYNRRSDFMWAIVNEHKYGRVQRQITLPLQHNRDLQNASIQSDEGKFKADINGMLQYRLLVEMFKSRRARATQAERDDLRRNNAQRSSQLFRQLRANSYRTVALCYATENLLKNRTMWWYAKEYRSELNDLIERNCYVLRSFCYELGRHKLQPTIQKVMEECEAEYEDIAAEFSRWIDAPEIGDSKRKNFIAQLLRRHG